jgi:copper(I)-binding protein
MLFQLKKALHTGETVRLVFITAQGATAEAEAPVKKVPAGR